MSNRAGTLDVRLDSLELLEKAGAGLDDIELPLDGASPMTEALDQLGL